MIVRKQHAHPTACTQLVRQRKQTILSSPAALLTGRSSFARSSCGCEQANGPGTHCVVRSPRSGSAEIAHCCPDCTSQALLNRPRKPTRLTRDQSRCGRTGCGAALAPSLHSNSSDGSKNAWCEAGELGQQGSCAHTDSGTSRPICHLMPCLPAQSIKLHASPTTHHPHQPLLPAPCAPASRQSAMALLPAQ